MAGVSIGIGLASAAETLFSQVWKNKLVVYSILFAGAFNVKTLILTDIWFQKLQKGWCCAAKR